MAFSYNGGFILPDKFEMTKDMVDKIYTYVFQNMEKGTYESTYLEDLNRKLLSDISIHLSTEQRIKILNLHFINHVNVEFLHIAIILKSLKTVDLTNHIKERESHKTQISYLDYFIKADLPKEYILKGLRQLQTKIQIKDFDNCIIGDIKTPTWKLILEKLYMMRYVDASHIELYRTILLSSKEAENPEIYKEMNEAIINNPRYVSPLTYTIDRMLGEWED